MKQSGSAPEADLAERLASIQERTKHCEDLLIESEHRFIPMAVNLVRHMTSGDRSKKIAAVKACLYYLVPGGRMITIVLGGSVIALLTLFLMKKNNELLVDQNYYMQSIAYSQEVLQRTNQKAGIIERLTRPLEGALDKPFYNNALRQNDLEALIELTRAEPKRPVRMDYESLSQLTARLSCDTFGVLCPDGNREMGVWGILFTENILAMVEEIQTYYCADTEGGSGKAIGKKMKGRASCSHVTAFIDLLPGSLNDVARSSEMLMLISRDGADFCSVITSCEHIGVLRLYLSTVRPKLTLDNMFLNDLKIPKLYDFRVTAKGANFSNSDFLAGALIGANLKGANLNDASFFDLFMYDVNLSDISFERAEFREVSFIKIIIGGKKVSLKEGCVDLMALFKGSICH